MKLLILVCLAVALAGCAGINPLTTAPGGAEYLVEFEDGIPTRARARVANESETVRFRMVKDENGAQTVEFSKEGTRPSGAEAALTAQSELLRALVPLVPAR